MKKLLIIIKFIKYGLLELNQIFIFLINYLRGKKFFYTDVDRVGEFIMAFIGFDEFLKKENNKSNHIIVYSDNSNEFKIANKFILNEILATFQQKNIRLINSVFLIKFFKFINSKKNLSAKFDIKPTNEYYNFIKIKNLKINNMIRSQLTNGELNKNFYFIDLEKFNNKHSNLVTNLLKSNNLKKKNYITTFTRDNEYLKSIYPKFDFSYHEYRNLGYEKLEQSINFIISRNLKAVRVGNIKKKINKSLFSDDHIDLNYSLNNEHIEMCMISNSKFFLTDTSGIADIADIFNVPTAKVNWCPVFSSVKKKAIILPSLFKSKTTKKLLNFFDVFELLNKSGLFYNQKTLSYNDLDLEIVKSSEEDILNTTKEINSRIDEDNFSPLNDYQIKFEEKMRRIGFINPGLIENNFIKKNYKLFV